jgi:Fanconi anemia group M protein
MDTFVDRDIFGQLQALADAAVRPVLIIEGEDLYGQRNMHPNAVRGALSAIALDMGISIFFTGDAEETAGMLWVMANREGSERGAVSPHRHTTYRSVTEQQEYIISAFPGVGPKHARLLLDACGSAEGVICADEETLLEIPGIGPVIAGAVIDMAKKGYKK